VSNLIVGIIDYGMGNMRSVQNSLNEIDVNSVIVADPDKLSNYDALILPGVGAFDVAMSNLRQSGMDSALSEAVEQGKILLGICLGMQLICGDSLENGAHTGLGYISAHVLPFPTSSEFKVPHMGWNSITQNKPHPVYDNIENNADVYFVHSFHVECKIEEDVIGVTDHGILFASIVLHENVIGMQFHPEKSQRTGLKLLSNIFIENTMEHAC